MYQLLEHVLYLKAAPTGDAITPTIKLALYTIIVQGKGDAIEIDAARFGPLIHVTHVKSISRLLKQMQGLDLITLIQTRNKAGQWVNPVVYPLPKIKRKPGNIQVTGEAPGNIGVTRPGNIQVTGQDPVTYRLPDSEADKQGPQDVPGNIQVTGPRGTVLAFISPSQLDNNIRDTKEGGDGNIQVTSLLENPAVRSWLTIMQEDVSLDMATFISKRVEVIEIWEDILEGWKATPGWNNLNVSGQVERYKKAAKDYVAPLKPKVKDPAEEEALRRKIYGS